jgi:hypothetical protein
MLHTQSSDATVHFSDMPARALKRDDATNLSFLAEQKGLRFLETVQCRRENQMNTESAMNMTSANLTDTRIPSSYTLTRFNQRPSRQCSRVTRTSRSVPLTRRTTSLTPPSHPTQKTPPPHSLTAQLGVTGVQETNLQLPALQSHRFLLKVVRRQEL